MQSWISPRRLTGSRRACLLALAAVVFGAPTAVVQGGPASATTTAVTPTVTVPLATSTLECLMDPCYSPEQFQVAYGIQPLLGAGSTAAARP
jgi:hypothetical protein